ncbi:MAG TPA: hypothetical protein VJ377_03480, partial [Dehalococcoidales bacterium]|nr:hypothetical protein [Dehalococcoidales bacterium]
MKISIIGAAGCVGSSIACNIVTGQLADEIMVADIRKDWLEHHAIDFFDAAVASGIDVRVNRGGHEDLAGSDIVIMAAGISAPRGTGLHGGTLPTRQQLLPGSLDIIREWAPAINRHCPEAIVIMVTNPAEVMNYAAFRLCAGQARRRFIGYSLNDTTRFVIATADALGVVPSRIEATVVGEHGGSMVLLFSTVRLDGKPVTIKESIRAKIRERTAEYLPHMIKLNLPRTSGWLTGVGVARVVRAIVNDTGEVIPCAAVVDGEY